MQHNERNPHMSVENPIEERKKALDEFYKNHPELQEVDRLCYEVFFINKDGAKLLSILNEQYLQQPLIDPSSPSASTLAIYWSGFTDCIKNFKTRYDSHKKRISAASQQS